MSDRTELLVSQERMYALTVDEDGVKYLEVVCGGFAMENVAVRLTDEEVSAYERKGRLFLDTLASKVAKQRSFFADRIVSGA